MRIEYPILFAAAFVGGLTLLLFSNHVSGIRQEYEKQLQGPKDVAVAESRLEPGQVIQESDVVKKEVPEAYMHQNTVAWDERNFVIGQKVLIPIRKGQPLLWTDLESSTLTGAGTRIPRGQRAVTVPVDMVTGVSGLVEPNCHVDLIGTFKLDTENQDALSSLTVLQNVTVLAVNGRIASALGTTENRGSDEAKGEIRTVTVLLDPAQSEFLVLTMELVRSMGTRIFCVLRSPEDSQVADPRMAQPVGNFRDLIIQINKERKKWLERE